MPRRPAGRGCRQCKNATKKKKNRCPCAAHWAAHQLVPRMRQDDVFLGQRLRHLPRQPVGQPPLHVNLRQQQGRQQQPGYWCTRRTLDMCTSSEGKPTSAIVCPRWPSLLPLPTCASSSSSRSRACGQIQGQGSPVCLDHSLLLPLLSVRQSLAATELHACSGFPPAPPPLAP